MLSKIHVNQHHIKANQKGENLPVFTVKQGKHNFYAEEVYVDGPSKLVYHPNDPLSCGARVWIETEARVHMVGKTTFKKLQDS